MAEVRRDLSVLKTQVGSDTTALNQDASQLLGAQTSLSAAQAHVTQQATLITSLQACLVGVEQALNELAIGKQGRRHRRAQRRLEQLHGGGGLQWLTADDLGAVDGGVAVVVTLGVGVLVAAVWTDIACPDPEPQRGGRARRGERAPRRRCGTSVAVTQFAKAVTNVQAGLAADVDRPRR